MMEASLWGLSSVVLLNLHVRLLRSLRQPVPLVRMLTKGQCFCQGCTSASEYLLTLVNKSSYVCRAEEASYYRKEAEEAELRLTEAQAKLRQGLHIACV